MFLLFYLRTRVLEFLPDLNKQLEIQTTTGPNVMIKSG